VIRATIVLLVAHLVIPRLRSRSAAERHLWWSVCLMTGAMIPLIGAVVPSWQPEWAWRVADTWPSLVTVQPWAATGSADVIVRATAVEAETWTITQWALAAWVCGALVFIALLARDAAKLVPLVRSASPISDRVILSVADELARGLRLSRVPVLLVSRRAVMPITWGLRRPRVLLPAAALEWPRERVHAVLAHELAHVDRGDWLWHVLAQMACAIYWFNPLFWSAERALGRESEQAADDKVLGMGVEAGQYAGHLIDIVRASRVAMSPRAPAVAMARAVHLERRVAALLRPQTNRTSVSRRHALAMTLCALAVGLPLAAVTADGANDVDIRAVDLPLALRTSSGVDREPMLPSVRRATSDIATADGQNVVLPEIAEYTTPPLYSDEARRQGLQGIVTIAVHVDERGQLASARVEKGLGAGLDQNALVALRQWRFHSGRRDGVPVAMDAEVDIEFDLRSEAVNELIANDMATLVGPGVTAPRVVRTSRLPLPAMNASGAVVLDVVLLQDGSPKIVRILRSLTPDADERAVRHFEQWRFTPAMKNGVPVKVRMNAEVRFHG